MNRMDDDEKTNNMIALLDATLEAFLIKPIIKDLEHLLNYNTHHLEENDVFREYNHAICTLYRHDKNSIPEYLLDNLGDIMLNNGTTTEKLLSTIVILNQIYEKSLNKTNIYSAQFRETNIQ